jgi:hypothetical protein
MQVLKFFGNVLNWLFIGVFWVIVATYSLFIVVTCRRIFVDYTYGVRRLWLESLKNMQLENAEDSVESLKFLRIVRNLNTNVYYLASPVQTAYLRPGKNHAICKKITPGECRGLVSKNCSCGFYSHKSIKKLMWATIALRKKSDAVALVRVWGKTQEGTTGFRSEWQDIHKLFVPSVCHARKCKMLANQLCLTEYPNKIYKQVQPCCDMHVKSASLSIQNLRDDLQIDVEWA